MKHILLIRHGLPHEGHPVHPGDPPLHPAGMRHARRLATRLQREGVDCIVSSPQRRAMDTAQPLARLLGIAPTIYDGLAEVDHGTDRYRSVETMQAEDAKRFSEFMASPARFFGKDPDQFRQGVLGAFEAAMREASGKRIAIFAHGMTIKTNEADVSLVSAMARTSNPAAHPASQAVSRPGGYHSSPASAGPPLSAALRASNA